MALTKCAANVQHFWEIRYAVDNHCVTATLMSVGGAEKYETVTPLYQRHNNRT